MKRKILLLFLLLLFSKTNAQTIHLIMVSDYADPKFGVVSQADEEAINDVFTTVEWALNYKLSKTYLNNNNDNNTFDSKNVSKTINTLQTNPEDMIVLFYSGFGYYPAKSKSIFPSFKLSDYKKTPLSLDDIANKIKAKTVRLGIVLADCRDSFPTPFNKQRSGFTAVEDFRKLILRKIFLEKTGILKIASSSKGESTWKMLDAKQSVFVSSFKNNIELVLKFKKEEEISKISLESILSNTQIKMNSELDKNIKQTANWVFTPYKNDENTRFKQYPPDAFVFPTYTELKNELTIIANSNDTVERSNSSKTLLEMFTKDAKIEILMIEEQTSKTVNLSIEDYISQTNKYDKKIKRDIDFKFYDYNRTDDFKKFDSLKFTEKTNQNQ